MSSQSRHLSLPEPPPLPLQHFPHRDAVGLWHGPAFGFDVPKEAAPAVPLLAVLQAVEGVAGVEVPAHRLVLEGGLGEQGGGEGEGLDPQPRPPPGE